MKLYCDDVNCPNFEYQDCTLEFEIKFRMPKSWDDIHKHNFGYVMSKVCRKKFTHKKSR